MSNVRLAEELLIDLGVTEPEEIDLEAIAYDQGALVRYRDLGGCEARIIGNGDRAIISVDRRHNSARVRFSTAHELGHWAHHRGHSLICKSEDIGNRTQLANSLEKVADRYAADLLLPRYLFEPIADSLKQTNYKNLETLATRFSTSLTATAIRLVDYGPEPAILVCHGQSGRQWFHRPRYVPDNWFPKKQLNADSFAMDVLYGNESISRRALMDADTWLNGKDAYRYELYEQSFKIDNGRILTFLIFKDEEMLEDR